MDYETWESPNPYLLHLEKSLSDQHKIINQSPNKRGVLDLFRFLSRSDIFFFNWIEDISAKKFGKLQTILFLIFLFMAKRFGKKLIWVLHNKYSHEKTNRQWIRFAFERMIKNADIIITHSKEGIDFVAESYPKYASKVKYIIHPVEAILPTKSNVIKDFDLLIWGTIYRYKGVTEFVEFVHDSPNLHDKKIMIAGICPDPALKENLKGLLRDNIKYIDEFINIEDLAKLANKSKFVLFTYNSDSVLSSGSLMDSIRMSSVIIGPDRGAFRDLKSFNFIKIYQTYEDISAIVDSSDTAPEVVRKEVEQFCLQNSWDLYGEKLKNVSENLL